MGGRGRGRGRGRQGDTIVLASLDIQSIVIINCMFYINKLANKNDQNKRYLQQQHHYPRTYHRLSPERQHLRGLPGRHRRIRPPSQHQNLLLLLLRPLPNKAPQPPVLLLNNLSRLIEPPIFRRASQKRREYRRGGSSLVR